MSGPDPTGPRTAVRPVGLTDLPAVLALKNASWRETYGHVLPASVFDEKDARLREDVAGWTRVLASGARVYLAEEVRDADAGPGAVVVGMACVGERRPDPRYAAALAGTGLREDDLPAAQLSAIYVLARAQGTGVGPRLLDAALGEEPAVLWVLAGNARAEAFYARRGFEAVGAPVPLGDPWGDAGEQLMLRR